MIEAREVLTGKVNVGTKEVYPPLVDLEATPTKEVQEFNHDGEYGYDKVKVNPIPDEYIIPNGELDINANGEVDVTTFRMARVGVYTPPTLQNKSVEIITNGTTNITADEGYDGLGNVEVVTDIVPSIETGIIAKGTSGGYLTELETFGFTSIPRDYMRTTTTTNQQNTIMSNATSLKLNEGITNIGKYAFYRVNETLDVIFPSTLTKIYDYAFYNCKGIKATELPDNITHIEDYSFYNCSGLELTKLPDKIFVIDTYAFYGASNIKIKSIPDITTIYTGAFIGCSSIPQLSMNTRYIEGGSTTGAFYNCTGLNAVWIGSSIITISTYAFNGCTNLAKIFIDKPRATIEAMTSYSNKFGATNATIICNDDEGFMTQEEFDAIDWSTYTG